MESWLKAAEGLLEVVDRKAKQVVGEKADEYSDSQSPASNGQGSQPKRTKPRKKVNIDIPLASGHGLNMSILIRCAHVYPCVLTIWLMYRLVICSKEAP
uniref:Uncharacterized protein n=1 Tax=Rhizophora mucronata TaxID=61149 RepID=A0A2P2MN53_RHIMU